MSATNALRACVSSGPEIFSVISEPCTAARVKIPRMLFPSISFPSFSIRTEEANRFARFMNFTAALACSPSLFLMMTFFFIMEARLNQFLERKRALAQWMFFCPCSTTFFATSWRLLLLWRDANLMSIGRFTPVMIST